ncbi:MAG: AAA family ATPase [Saprospiraceae bacterium]
MANYGKTEYTEARFVSGFLAGEDLLANAPDNTNLDKHPYHLSIAHFHSKLLYLSLNIHAMPKRTPLSLSDFRQVIDRGAYYVDKTALIRGVVEGAGVQLHCRPRRFGKTLNLSLLRYFFDCRGDHRYLFDGLVVAQDEEMMTLHQGKYPVITLSFKDVKARSYTSAMQAMTTLLYNEWARHTCLENTPEYDSHLAEMASVVKTGEVKAFIFRDAIMKLAYLLHAHHGAPVLLLIDEYDTPLVEAWLKGYYDDMIEFMRPLLGGVFKDNDEVLFKGVLTGILRVAKESLFSGLNNFISEAGLDMSDFSDKFGFTESEVATLLAHRGYNGREMEEVRAWYDGYRYGGIPVYNPWSILNYAFAKEPTLRPYWVNTGGHDLLKRLFFNQQSGIKDKLEALLRGDTIDVYVDEFLTFRGLETTPDAVISLMYFAGYLRVVGEYRRGYRIIRQLSIPNREVKLAYEDTLVAWFNEDLGRTFNDDLLDALIAGDVLTFGEGLARFVLRVASFYDTADNRAEHFYHAFLLGLLARLDTSYHIRSNRESGQGRYDICLIPKDATGKGIVMEIKAVRPHRGENINDRLAEARTQILVNQYDTELVAQGVTDILRLAVAVEGKEVLVEQV